MIERLLVLWGDRAVGKSTLLAAAFGSFPLPAGASSDELPGITDNELTTLQGTWARLVAGGHEQSTTHAIDYRIHLNDGSVLRIRDVVGDWSAAEARVREQLVPADGVLIVLEMNAPEARRIRQERAIRASERILRSKPCAVALTKADAILDQTSKRWQRPPNWYASLGYRDTIDGDPPVPREHWWPVSSLGFDRTSGRPACVLGEYDFLVPHNVTAPVNVKEMMGDLIGRMMAAPPGGRSGGARARAG